jgi:hypothetical protein
LDAAAEKVWVDEQVAFLERITTGLETFWSDARRHHAVVLLQDRTDQIVRAMETSQKALRTTLSVMLPRNPPPTNFRGLLDAFRSYKHVHHLVKL